jgi:hypothetical protein
VSYGQEHKSAIVDDKQTNNQDNEQITDKQTTTTANQPTHRPTLHLTGASERLKKVQSQDGLLPQAVVLKLVQETNCF